MDVELTAEESAALQAALRSYLSDLRVEIADTDNPEYKRTLRAEREALERALAKLDGPDHSSGAPTAPGAASDTPAFGRGQSDGLIRVVRLWWTATEA